MLSNFLAEITKGLVGGVIPPVQRYFTYFFILIGIMWLGGANYYYYAEDCKKFKGALITGFIFLILASATALWECYIKRKRAAKNNTNELAVTMLPVVLPALYSILKNVIIHPRLLKTITVLGVVGSALYYGLRNKDDKRG